MGLLLTSCGSSSNSGVEDDELDDTLESLATPQGTIALGDESYDDLEVLDITFHALSLSGPDGTVLLIEEGVDDPVTIDALSYVDTAAPFAASDLPAGTYNQFSFEITVTAMDDMDDVIAVIPLFDDEATGYENIETQFPLGPRSFTVAAPAVENQPLLFLHVDVESSVTQGTSGSILFAPEIFLSTFAPMDLEGTVTAIDTEAELFAIEDESGAVYRVQPTDCTTVILGLDSTMAGIDSAILFNNIEVGDELSMNGFLGLDPGCTGDQDAPFYHPRRVRGELTLAGVTAVTGIVQENDAGTLTLMTVESVDIGSPGGPEPGAVMPGDSFQADYNEAILLASRGEVRELTGAATRLQIGEVLLTLARDVTSSGAGSYEGTAALAHTRKTFFSGMLNAVESESLTLDADGTKKASGSDHPAIAFAEDEPGAPSVELGVDTEIVLGADSRVHVGPLDGWDLNQVLDPYYDNQLKSPGMVDGQDLSMGCVDEASADVDIDAGLLCAYVDHRENDENVWTVQRLRVEVSSDATQKYIAWYAGTPGCTLPSNGASMNNPCIATDGLHRERILLGETMDSGWNNFGQSGAGKFGTSILNAGSRVPDATTPIGSDVAGWDDENEMLLLGIDFDGDMYPFDDAADSCVGLSERVWVDLSQAQFLYFATDPDTEEVEYTYLTTYAAFKAEVIDMQDLQSSNPCGSGFRSNVGFSFTGVLDKTSFLTEGAPEIVPVIRCISGQVFDAGCVPE